MDAELLNPSLYIKAVEFQGRDVTLAITDVEIDELEDTKGKKKKKGLISFAKTEKKWVLNVTNLRCLIAMFGRETNNWIGKRVTLYPAPNEKSETGVAIRVRGSPDLTADVKVTLKIGRDAPKPFLLRVTGKANGKAAPAAAPKQLPEAPPPPDEPGADDGPTPDELEEARAREAEEARQQQ